MESYDCNDNCSLIAVRPLLAAPIAGRGKYVDVRELNLPVKDMRAKGRQNRLTGLRTPRVVAISYAKPIACFMSTLTQPLHWKRP